MFVPWTVRSPSITTSLVKLAPENVTESVVPTGCPISNVPVPEVYVTPVPAANLLLICVSDTPVYVIRPVEAL